MVLPLEGNKYNFSNVDKIADYEEISVFMIMKNIQEKLEKNKY